MKQTPLTVDVQEPTFCVTFTANKLNAISPKKQHGGSRQGTSRIARYIRGSFIRFQPGERESHWCKRPWSGEVFGNIKKSQAEHRAPSLKHCWLRLCMYMYQIDTGSSGGDGSVSEAEYGSTRQGRTEELLL
ncbi:hypothetical protein CBL_12112 [Carabus blaptoides fortunei]